MHTPWYTPSRVGEHQVVRSISSLRPSLAPSSARDYRRRRTHEKENETRFLSFFFFFSPFSSSFFHSFHTFTVRARVHITKKKKKGKFDDGADTKVEGSISATKFCTSNFRYRKPHVSPARTLAARVVSLRVPR